MDESHRLKCMPENYDKALFNQLYKETRELRQKLAFEIDSRKFGVDHKEVLAWFDVKFIYAFNKYYGDERLKGFIINTLRTFKLRVVKNSYQNKFQIHVNAIDINDAYDLCIEEEGPSETSSLFKEVEKYFRDRLSIMAYTIWEIELNPPPYILKHFKNQTRIPKLPDELVEDYLGISQQELRNYRAEIKEVTALAKKYFQMKAKEL